MAMQQIVRRMASRVFSAGATRPSPSFQGTGHLSYDSGAFSTRGGVPFSTRCFFCSEPPPPLPRRTQLFIDCMCEVTAGFVESFPKYVAVFATLHFG